MRLTFADFKDCLAATAYMASIVASAIGMILNAAALMWIIIAGIFMLMDESYVPLFRPWVIISVIYIVIAVTVLAWRASPRRMTVVIEHRQAPVLHYAGQARPRLLGMETPAPGPFHWSQAEGGVCFAEAGGYTVSVTPAGDLWIWTLARGGVVEAEGAAASFAEAERLAASALYRGRGG
jgi:hypothetical protein